MTKVRTGVCAAAWRQGERARDIFILPSPSRSALAASAEELMAPSLSFDLPGDDNNEQSEDDGALEVGVPADNPRRDSTRTLFKQQVQRTMSRKWAKDRASARERARAAGALALLGGSLRVDMLPTSGLLVEWTAWLAQRIGAPCPPTSEGGLASQIRAPEVPSAERRRCLCRRPIGLAT